MEEQVKVADHLKEVEAVLFAAKRTEKPPGVIISYTSNEARNLTTPALLKEAQALASEHISNPQLPVVNKGPYLVNDEGESIDPSKVQPGAPLRFRRDYEFITLG